MSMAIINGNGAGFDNGAQSLCRRCKLQLYIDIDIAIVIVIFHGLNVS